jgi:hypothetical protein
VVSEGFSHPDKFDGPAAHESFPRDAIRALLRSRLVFAAQGGCDLAVVTTQPGSISQANVMREGFSLLYAHAILVRTPR